MKSLIALVCLALLAQSTPLGDRAIARRHKLTGVPLARGLALRSKLDAPASCASGIVPTSSDNSTITPPDAGNVTVTDTADNSTVTAPTGDDDSTETDDSDDKDDSEDTDDSDAPTANSTDTKDKDTEKRGFDLFQDLGGFSDFGGFSSLDGLDGFGGFEEFGDSWLDLCLHSGGDIFSSSSPCIDLGFDGYTALLADADVCAQQEIAERMITFAKSSHVENSEDLIRVALGYRRQARQVVEVFGFHPSTPYCHRRPIHSELFGVWNSQLHGVTLGLYGGPNYPIVTFGDDASCPYGLSPDSDNCSCIENDKETAEEDSDSTETSDDTTDVDVDGADADADADDADADSDEADADSDEADADSDDADADADEESQKSTGVIGEDPATAPTADAADINEAAEKKARRGSAVWGR